MATLFSNLLSAARRYGWWRVCSVDQLGQLRYAGLLMRCALLGRRVHARSSYIGVMLPTSNAAVVAFFALSSQAEIPVMLNFTAGTAALQAACQAAQLTTILTARRFIDKAGLQREVTALESQGVSFVYVDQLRFGWADKRRALGQCLRWALLGEAGHDSQPAVLLFTSGSEGAPKGVVLSHANLLANQQQICQRIEFSAADRMLNVLPVFHSFGLAIGVVLPLLHGMQVYQMPNPLAYKDVVTRIADFRATLLFAADTFLLGYARKASPADFASLRAVFAGAEKLKPTTRALWQQQFEVDIIEGYGVTETSPVLAINDPADNQHGTVGRLLARIEYRLQPVEGVEAGGRLLVRGPNVMQGYLTIEQPGQIQSLVDGWHDTGDIVRFDAEGRLEILGRAKRFAKIGGEMVSLVAVEVALQARWPEAKHAVLALANQKGRESLVWVTDDSQADLSVLPAHFKSLGLSNLMLPSKRVVLDSIPCLGAGKIDYAALLDSI